VHAAGRTSEHRNAAPRLVSFVRESTRYHHLRWQSQESQSGLL